MSGRTQTSDGMAVTTRKHIPHKLKCGQNNKFKNPESTKNGLIIIKTTESISDTIAVLPN